MNNRNDNNVISFNINGIDLNKLYKQIFERKIKSLVIYGVGDNANSVCTLLSNIGVDIKYFVDVKADRENFRFNDKEVVKPAEFVNKFNGEYVVITPSQHSDIVIYLELNGIPKDKIITSFFTIETVDINFNYSLLSPSKDIDYCKARPIKPIATFATIVYNTPEYMFRRSIESVLRQSIKEFIYVIIVNGATDKTLDIACQYAELDARVKVVNLDANYPWTDSTLLNVIKENIYGNYWCQLDSDDFYAENFLEVTNKISIENDADIVCVRTMAFCEDKDYSPITNNHNYFAQQKYFIYAAHAPYRVIGHHNIIRAFANSLILGTFWGRLYKSSLMLSYLDCILGTSQEERDLYFRLDIGMTYKVLSFTERFINSEKILHFASYSTNSSTYSLAPVEWLTTFWNAYLDIKKELKLWNSQNDADNMCKSFLHVNLPWMLTRNGMLQNVKNSPYQEKVMMILREIYNDELFNTVLFEDINKNPIFNNFYQQLQSLVRVYSATQNTA